MRISLQICDLAALNLLHIILLTPRIWRRFLDFWKTRGSLICRWVISFTDPALYSQGKSPQCLLNSGLDSPQEWSPGFGENKNISPLPAFETISLASLDRRSLHRISFRGFISVLLMITKVKVKWSRYRLGVAPSMGTGSFPGVKCGRGVLLTTHLLLVPRSWKCTAISLPTLWATPGLNRDQFFLVNKIDVNLERCWNDADRKKNKFLGKKLFPIPLCSPQTPFYSMWIRLHWDRFSSTYFNFPLSVPFHQFSNVIFHSSFVDAIKS